MSNSQFVKTSNSSSQMFYSHSVVYLIHYTKFQHPFPGDVTCTLDDHFTEFRKLAWLHQLTASTILDLLLLKSLSNSTLHFVLPYVGAVECHSLLTNLSSYPEQLISVLSNYYQGYATNRYSIRNFTN